MKTTRAVNALRCPSCRSLLTEQPEALHCVSEPTHRYPFQRGYAVFAPQIGQGKYDEAYAKRYAFLWAYGHETRHSGMVESLYRSVGALVAEALISTPHETPLVIDCGCGTGRCTADGAALAPAAAFIGVDASFAKLDLAQRILIGSEGVSGDLLDAGFTTPFTIRSRSLDNVLLLQADGRSLPIADRVADVFLSVNLLDRVEGGPKAGLQEARRVVRPGGTLIVTTPMNWTTSQIWREYPTAESLLTLIRDIGFEPKTWFDNLSYREILDGRGSFEEFTTLVCSAVARTD